MRTKLSLMLALAGLVTAAAVMAATGGKVERAALPLPRPTVTDYTLVSTSTTPPTEAQCFTANSDSGGRRCFTPASMHSAYNLAPLYALGDNGAGQTIAIIDSYGSDTIAHDLNVFDTAFNLPHMCGEEGVTCAPGMPTLSQLDLQGSPATKPQGGTGTQLEDKAAWALEVSLDVEWAHSVAPGANILLVHTPVGRDPRRAGLPADHQGRGLRGETPPGPGDHAEPRRGRGLVPRLGRAPEPPLRVRRRGGERRHRIRFVR